VECVALAQDGLDFWQFLIGFLVTVGSILLAAFGSLTAVYGSYKLAGNQNSVILDIIRNIGICIVTLQGVVSIMSWYAIYQVNCNIGAELPQFFVCGMYLLVLGLLVPTVWILKTMKKQ
jgi:hypothetical protein